MSIWKDKKRKDWRYSFQRHGKIYAGGGFKTKREAQAARAERKKVVADTQSTPTAMAFSEAANTYLDYAQRRFAKQTYEYKALVYRLFLKFHGDLPINQITPQLLHQYLNTRPTNNNYNAHRKDLSALFTFVRKQLKVNIPHPCWDLEKMPVTKVVKRIPSEEDVLRLLMAANLEERALLLVIFHTLARIDEILRLTWQDVNFEHNTIRLWTRKRSDGSLDYDELPMNKPLWTVLQSLWKRRKQDLWVFYNEMTKFRYNHRPKLMRSICIRAGIEAFGFHALRHFVATYLVDHEKVGKKTISGLLRHKSLSTTEIYLHSVDESQREAMRKLEGFGVASGLADLLAGFIEKGA